MAQCAVKRRFGKYPGGKLQEEIERADTSRHMWAYAMRIRYGPQPLDSYHNPPIPRIGDSVSERAGNRYNVNERS